MRDPDYLAEIERWHERNDWLTPPFEGWKEPYPRPVRRLTQASWAKWKREKRETTLSCLMLLALPVLLFGVDILIDFLCNL